MKKEIERLQEELSQQNKARKQQEDQVLSYTLIHSLYISKLPSSCLMPLMLSVSVLKAVIFVLQLAELEQILRNLEVEAKERKSQLEQVLIMYMMHVSVIFPFKTQSHVILYWYLFLM